MLTHVYDPSESQQPFGFLEVKCPHTVGHLSPTEACSTPEIFCELDSAQVSLD